MSLKDDIADKIDKIDKELDEVRPFIEGKCSTKMEEAKYFFKLKEASKLIDKYELVKKLTKN